MNTRGIEECSATLHRHLPAEVTTWIAVAPMAPATRRWASKQQRARGEDWTCLRLTCSTLDVIVLTPKAHAALAERIVLQHMLATASTGSRAGS